MRRKLASSANLGAGGDRDMATTPQARKLLKVPKDLEVHFDDGRVVQAHALILVLASPIFRDMLTDDDGGLLNSIELPGKDADEFDLFQQALLPASLRFATLTDEATLFMLCRWAHEYEVDALRTMCEDHLLANVPVTEGSLQHALAYKLERRRAQCIDEMKEDLPRYVGTLKQLATTDALKELNDLWPLLCRHALIEPFPMPPADQVLAHPRHCMPEPTLQMCSEHASYAVWQVAAMWPFVEAAIGKPATSTLIQAELKRAVADRMNTAFTGFNETTSYWSNTMYAQFWSSHASAVGRLKDLGLPI